MRSHVLARLLPAVALACMCCLLFGQQTDPKQTKCPACKGANTVKCKECEAKGEITLPEQCDRCVGSGKIQCADCTGTGKTKCLQCNGTGKVHDEKLKRDFGCQACGGERSTQSKGAGVVACPKCSRGVMPCPDCKGGGKKIVRCIACEGAGSVDCASCVELTYAPQTQEFRNQNTEAIQQLDSAVRERQTAQKTRAKRVGNAELTYRLGAIAMTYNLVIDKRFGQMPTRAEVLEAMKQVLVCCTTSKLAEKLKFLRIRVRLLDYNEKGKETPEQPLGNFMWEVEQIRDIVWDAPVNIDIERFASKKVFNVELK